MAAVLKQVASSRDGLVTHTLTHDSITMVVSLLTVANGSDVPVTTTVLKPGGGVAGSAVTAPGQTSAVPISTVGANKLTILGWGAGIARGYGLEVT